VVGRSQKSLDDKRREKISIFGNVNINNIISNPDVNSIYSIPLIFEEQKFAEKILKTLRLPLHHPKTRTTTVRQWQTLVSQITNASKPIKVGIVGKYFDTGDFVLKDAYISVIEAIKHAAWAQNRKPEIQWIDSHEFEKSPQHLKKLKQYDAIIVPGGFGSRGVEGKIKTIEYVRTNKIPYLGLCYGMQLAVIEFSRNVLKLKGAHTEEINPQTPHPVIHILPEQKKLLAKKDYGATMRLGAYNCTLDKSSKVYQLYRQSKISERHRHRYEFNNNYRNHIEKAGLKVVGVNQKRNLVEIIELKGHPFFVGVQFHPEFESRPLRPHPLFQGLIKAGIK
jgi:CTP synthase